MSVPDAAVALSPSFAALGLPRKVLAALVLDDIEEPTPVQSAVVPDAIAGHDVLARARTGSGKTLAFGLPLAARLAGEPAAPHRPRGLVVVPTRELAGQVERSLELLARALRLRLLTVYGGTRYDGQVQALRRGVDVVVGTPGRLQDLIDRGVLRTDDIEVTVLDEADHLCDLGFYPDVDRLLAQTPAGGQRLLLSATLDGEVDKLVRTHLRDPRRHEIDPNAGAVTTMSHHVMTVGGFRDKIAAVAALVKANPRAIVFTRTRDGAVELRDALAAEGVTAVDLHGNLQQRVRERNLERFAAGRAQAVVATDVAARGIHVDGVELVVHFDPPTDPKGYLHRSGRTARAGSSGAVVTLVTPRQVASVAAVQRTAGVTARQHDWRDWRSGERLPSAEALELLGEERPAVVRREHKVGASRHSGRGRPVAAGRGRPQRRTGERGRGVGGAAPAGQRGAAGTSRSPKAKSRWTKADRDARR